MITEGCLPEEDILVNRAYIHTSHRIKLRDFQEIPLTDSTRTQTAKAPCNSDVGTTALSCFPFDTLEILQSFTSCYPHCESKFYLENFRKIRKIFQKTSEKDDLKNNLFFSAHC